MIVMHNMGKLGEDMAGEHYEALGFKIVDRNYKVHYGRQTGEIDLVAVKDKQLVFVEVKLRRTSRFGGPFEAVDQGKQQRLVKTAKLYVSQNPQYRDFGIRIDVAAVDIDNSQTPVIILANAIEDLD